MGINNLAAISHEIAKTRGQLDRPWFESLEGEVSELKACVRDMPCEFTSKHISSFTETEEELADVILVCLTTLHSRNVDIEKLLTEKCKFNISRLCI